MLSLAKLSSPYISYGVLSLFILTELNSNFAATDMKSQAYAPIWPNGPCLPRLQQGRDCFARGSHGVSGTETINNNFQLSDFVSGVRIEVLGYVNCTYNSKHMYNIKRASLSESLVLCTQC